MKDKRHWPKTDREKEKTINEACRKARAACNKLTESERIALSKRALKLIRG